MDLLQATPEPLPIWVTGFLVPILTTIISVIGTLEILKRTERYRSLATWKPYAKDLWKIKTEMSLELLTQASKVYLFAWSAFTFHKHDEKLSLDDIQTFQRTFFKHLRSIDTTIVKCRTVCSKKHIKAINEFQASTQTIYANYRAGQLRDDQENKLLNSYFQLINETREEIHAERLSTQERESIKEATKNLEPDPETKELFRIYPPK